jgi:hypothetical protein
MAQTYTLDEAAQRLGISPEDFKRRLRDDWKSVRSFRDGGTLRFRAADIDDLARAVGQASDPGLPYNDAGTPLSDSSDELLIDPPAPSSKKNKQPNQPLYMADDSDDILALPTNLGPASGSSKLNKPKGDSDVRLDMTPPKSDRKKTNQQLTEEIDLDLPGPTSAATLGKSSAKLTNPKSSGRIKSNAPRIPTPENTSDDGSSEFELSLDSDSDSFELQLNDSSEEVPLGGELPSSPAGRSGINLSRPADSGVSIEKKNKKGKAAEESEIDFELSTDSRGPAASRSMLSNPDEGSSEFELSLDDSSGSESMNALASSVQPSGDIFETDFELPAVADDESGSEVVSVDSSDTDLENSDFDLAISDTDAALEEDSASQVILADDEEPVVANSGRRSNFTDMEAEPDSYIAPIRTVAAAPPKWGPLPAVMLVLTFPLVILGALMSFELVRGMAGYQQPNAASAPLVRGVASMFGFKSGD